jgi:hypothetical protein
MTCDTINGSQSGNDGGNNEYYDGGCGIQNWCVCQWAFASYLQKAGGCDMVQSIVCDSINLEAVLAYKELTSQSQYNTALQCIVDRCGLDINDLPSRRKTSQSLNMRHPPSSLVYIIVGGMLAVISTIYWAYNHMKTKARRSRKGSSSNLLLENDTEQSKNHLPNLD